MTLQSFSPRHLVEKAKRSGFFQCRQCGLIWFGKPEAGDRCPEGPHGKPVHVALLCRACDAIVPAEQLVDHLSSHEHTLCIGL